MTGAHDESILRSLRRITRAIDLHSRELAKTHQLTAPQLVCLRDLATAGVITPSELAERVALSNATVTGILDRLERRELVTRERNPQDKRRVLVALTPRGRDIVQRAPTPLHQRFAQRLAQLPAEQQAELDGMLQRIVSMMEAEELDASPVLAAGPVTADSAEVAEFLAPPPDVPERAEPREGGDGDPNR